MTVRSARTQQILKTQLLLTVEGLSASDFGWIARAIKEAGNSKHRVRVGAVLVAGSRIAGAHNRIRNSPDISYLHATTHAEIGAIRKVADPRGGTIYVARLGAQGKMLPSFPCERCFPVVADVGIRRIVWWNGERWIKGKL